MVKLKIKSFMEKMIKIKNYLVTNNTHLKIQKHLLSRFGSTENEQRDPSLGNPIPKPLLFSCCV